MIPEPAGSPVQTQKIHDLASILEGLELEGNDFVNRLVNFSLGTPFEIPILHENDDQYLLILLNTVYEVYCKTHSKHSNMAKLY